MYVWLKTRHRWWVLKIFNCYREIVNTMVIINDAKSLGILILFAFGTSFWESICDSNYKSITFCRHLNMKIIYQQLRDGCTLCFNDLINLSHIKASYFTFCYKCGLKKICLCIVFKILHRFISMSIILCIKRNFTFFEIFLLTCCDENIIIIFIYLFLSCM